MITKRNIAAVVAEFLGTAVLAFTFLSVSRSSIGLLYFVAAASGLAITLMGLALGRDVQFNPAYTIGLAIVRRVQPLRALAYVLMQILGGYAAYALFKYLANGQPVSGFPTAYDAHLLVSEAAGAFVFAFAAAAGVFRASGLMTRAATAGGAYVLGLFVASAAATAQDPIRFINPAVALASQSWGWSTYVAGPLLGAILGVVLYALLFAERFGVVAAARPVAVAPLATVNDEQPIAPARTSKVRASVAKDSVKANAKPRAAKARSTKK